jgi:hypothetical protein
VVLENTSRRLTLLKTLSAEYLVQNANATPLRFKKVVSHNTRWGPQFAASGSPSPRRYAVGKDTSTFFDSCLLTDRQAAGRSYRWCSPPTSGMAITPPTDRIGRGSGESLSSDK